LENTVALRTILRNIIYNLSLFFRHPAALAVGFTFAADSFMFGTWVTLIPFVKDKLALSDGALGLSLFGMPIGLLIMNPVSPWLIQRFGLVRITIFSTVLMACSFVLPLWTADKWVLFAILFVIGMAVAVMNVGMNTCATNIEVVYGRKIMSTCHGMWSLGGVLGAAWSAMMLKWGVYPAYYLSSQAIILVFAVIFILYPHLKKVPEIPHENEGTGFQFALPKGDLLLMILLGAATGLCEGLAFDWSAVYLHDTLGAANQVAALGFACFSFSMMAMRFAGDSLIPLYGERKLLYFTVIAAVISLLVVVLAVQIWMGIFGFFLLGMSIALAAPILFNVSARVPGFAPGAGLATYATFSFIGFLVGPPCIGLISEAFGLAKGFLLVAGLTLATILCVPRIGYLKTADY
jgi:MFS family permease